MADGGFVKGNDEPQFYDQGRDWEMDRRLRLEQSERKAWWVAGIACVLALGLGIGLACLAPPEIHHSLCLYGRSGDRQRRVRQCGG